MIIDKNMTALANMPVKSESPEPGGKKRIIFEKTPVMSTYLVFFGFGPFEMITDELDRRVRAAVLPGMKENINYGLAFARKALNYCETCFGMAYPLPKLDLIAVPDFAFGAMENWGAITFRENLLLFDEQNTAADGQERICEVIAHEIVHQWFGNLVTPQDWKYLWLNESFATFFGYQVVDAHHEDWKVWEEFLVSQTAPALNRDSLRETSSIEIPGGSHVVINSATAPIIYSKGGSILRQIRGYMGEEEFEASLQEYLSKHAYGCTGSKDLWSSMETASGKPIGMIMEKWVTTAGHPLVHVEKKHGSLRVSQEPFTYLPFREPRSCVWPIPLCVRFYDASGAGTTKTLLMDGPELSIDLDENIHAYKINEMHTGFYRTMYHDKDNLKSLIAMAKEVKLHPIDRWGIENDLFAMLLGGRIDLSEYLKLQAPLKSERAPLPLAGKMAHFHDLVLLCQDEILETVKTQAAAHLKPALEYMGCIPTENDPHDLLRARNDLFWQAAILDLSGPVEQCLELFEKLMDGHQIHPDILRGIMQAGAWHGEEKVFEWFVRRIQDADSEQDRLNCLRGIGCFSKPELIEKILDYTIREVPERNRFVPVAQMAKNPSAVPLLWDWYTSGEKIFNSTHPIIHERIISSIVPVCGLLSPEEVFSWFKRSLAQNPPAADAIAMSLEKLEVNLDFRRRAAAS
jgi:tricorn protease interacting factor F2/3